MKLFAVVLLFTLMLLSCFSNAQTAINVGQCSGYSWQANCTAAGSPLCPSSGSGTCSMQISDSNGYAVATQQGSSAGATSSYICVQPGATVQFAETDAAKAFIVDFGSATTPFPGKSVFSGKMNAPDQAPVAGSAGSVPECNEYVILHCGSTSCTMGDPVVVVRGGLGRKK